MSADGILKMRGLSRDAKPSLSESSPLPAPQFRRSSPQRNGLRKIQISGKVSVRNWNIKTVVNVSNVCYRASNGSRKTVYGRRSCVRHSCSMLVSSKRGSEVSLACVPESNHLPLLRGDGCQTVSIERPLSLIRSRCRRRRLPITVLGRRESPQSNNNGEPKVAIATRAPNECRESGLSPMMRVAPRAGCSVMPCRRPMVRCNAAHR
jgi:hypothetical protein